jgi:hypothetical protein
LGHEQPPGAKRGPRACRKGESVPSIEDLNSLVGRTAKVKRKINGNNEREKN